jgi:hypothetical protein
MISDEDIENGYSICNCGHGVLLLQAGTEIGLHMCSQCKCHVADKEEFFKFKSGIEVLSK